MLSNWNNFLESVKIKGLKKAIKNEVKFDDIHVQLKQGGRSLKEVMTKVAEELDIQGTLKAYKAGSFGITFLWGDKTLKITTSESEAEMISKVIEKQQRLGINSIIKYDHVYKSFTKIQCDAPDIPIISYDNAIVYLIKDDEYTKSFKIPTLIQGLIKHKGNYFYFDHNIVQTPRTYSFNSVHSYDVYQITQDLAQKIIDTKIAMKWEILFNSFFNFSKRYLSIRRGNFTEWHSYSSYKSEDGLVLPQNTSPADLKDLTGITIKGYLDKHRKAYPNGGTRLEFNMSVWRNNKLEELFD